MARSLYPTKNILVEVQLIFSGNFSPLETSLGWQEWDGRCHTRDDKEGETRKRTVERLGKRRSRRGWRGGLFVVKHGILWITQNEHRSQ